MRTLALASAVSRLATFTAAQSAVALKICQKHVADLADAAKKVAADIANAKGKKKLKGLTLYANGYVRKKGDKSTPRAPETYRSARRNMTLRNGVVHLPWVGVSAKLRPYVAKPSKSDNSKYRNKFVRPSPRKRALLAQSAI